MFYYFIFTVYLEKDKPIMIKWWRWVFRIEYLNRFGHQLNPVPIAKYPISALLLNHHTRFDPDVTRQMKQLLEDRDV